MTVTINELTANLKNTLCELYKTLGIDVSHEYPYLNKEYGVINIKIQNYIINIYEQITTLIQDYSEDVLDIHGDKWYKIGDIFYNYNIVIESKVIYIIYSSDYDIFKIEGVTETLEAARLLEEITGGTSKAFEIQSNDDVITKYNIWKVKQENADSFVSNLINKKRTYNY